MLVHTFSNLNLTKKNSYNIFFATNLCVRFKEIIITIITKPLTFYALFIRISLFNTKF